MKTVESVNRDISALDGCREKILDKIGPLTEQINVMIEEGDYEEDELLKLQTRRGNLNKQLDGIDLLIGKAKGKSDIALEGLYKKDIIGDSDELTISDMNISILT